MYEPSHDMGSNERCIDNQHNLRGHVSSIFSSSAPPPLFTRFQLFLVKYTLLFVRRRKYRNSVICTCLEEAELVNLVN